MPPPSFRVCEITSCLHFLCVALPACRVHRQDRRESDLPVLHFNPLATLVWRCLPTPNMQTSQLTNNLFLFFLLKWNQQKPRTGSLKHMLLCVYVHEWNMNTVSLPKVLFFFIFFYLTDFRCWLVFFCLSELSSLRTGYQKCCGLGCIVRSLFSGSEWQWVPFFYNGRCEQWEYEGSWGFAHVADVLLIQLSKKKTKKRSIHNTLTTSSVVL